MKNYKFYNLSKDINHHEWNPWDESLVSTDINANVNVSENILQPSTYVYDINITSCTKFKSNTIDIKDTTRRMFIFNTK